MAGPTGTVLILCKTSLTQLSATLARQGNYCKRAPIPTSREVPITRNSLNLMQYRFGMPPASIAVKQIRHLVQASARSPLDVAASVCALW